MKRLLLVPALAIAAMLFAAQAHGGTARVFSQYLGGNLASPSEAQQTSYASFLSTNNIDFGVFYGPTSASGFGLMAEGYSTEYEYKSGMGKGGRVLVYKTSDWSVVQHDAAEDRGSAKYPNWCSAYVVERKSNGEQFYVVMFTGERFSGGSYMTYEGYLSARANQGPWLLVALPYNGALYTGTSNPSQVASNMSGSNTQVPNVSGTGAVFARNHGTLSASGVSVPKSTLGFGGEPAALATVTYIRTLTVTFNDWDGAEIKTESVLEGNDATPPDDPERVGHHFTGWSGSCENVQSNLTLVAEYNPDMFVVRFLDWDGEVLKSEMVAYGTDATPPESPTREGFRFFGWSAPYTGITEAVDLTAVYVEASAVTHWVTFKDHDGTELLRQEVLDGQDATPPADPTREGWHFTGWSGTYTGVTQDVTITATYAINSYAIEFQDWDGTVLKTEEVEYGSSATPPASPTRTGYHFVGWQGAYQNVAAAATVVAQYEINMYTVRFLHEDGTALSTQQVAYKSAATAPSTPAPLNDNRVFYKWSCGYSSITADLDVVAVFVNKLIEVGTAAEFIEYIDSDLMSKSVVTIALTNDISLSGATHSARQLYATIDGRGHTISSIPSSFKLFSELRGGTVRNIVFKGFRAAGNSNRTSLLASASYASSTVSGVVFDNCKWTLSSGSHGNSGMIYEVKGTTLMTNCVMKNCSVLGSNAGGSAQFIGGFVAMASNLRMVDCHFIVDNPGTVAVGDGIHAAGAFVGKCGSGVTLERCSNNALVKVTKTSGSENGAGAFVGGCWPSGNVTLTIKDCANFGTVVSTVNSPAGGFIGDACATNGTFTLSVKSCFNYGSVSSPLAAGGIAGSFRGANNTFVNCGNSGSISSSAGFAGGLIGRVRFNGSTKTAGFNSAFQYGSVSTESGFAGILMGGLFSSTGSGLTLVANNCFMAGSATASAGGKAGLVIGGCDSASTGELSLSVSGGGVLDSNASLQPGYNAAGQALQWTQPDSFAPTALVNRMVLSTLDAAAEAGGWMRWIQGCEYPELALFGEMYTHGIAVVFF